MGETAAETLTEIASVRDALERDISTLAGRMPPKEELVRGAAIGGGALAGLASLVAVVVKLVSDRMEERRLEHEADVQADALVEALARRGQRLDESGSADDAVVDEGGSGGFLWALLAVAAGFAAAFAWVRRGGQLDRESFTKADPHEAVEADLRTGGGLPTRPAGTTPTP